MYGYIYKIVNDANSKVYIGQTIQPVSTRFRKHVNSAYLIDYETGDYKYHYKLSRAIRHKRYNFII